MFHNWVLFHWTLGRISKLVNANAMPFFFHSYGGPTVDEPAVHGSLFAFHALPNNKLHVWPSCCMHFCLVLIVSLFRMFLWWLLTCQPRLDYQASWAFYTPDCVCPNSPHFDALHFVTPEMCCFAQRRSFGDGIAHRGNRQEPRMGEFLFIAPGQAVRQCLSGGNAATPQLHWSEKKVGTLWNFWVFWAGNGKQSCGRRHSRGL